MLKIYLTKYPYNKVLSMLYGFPVTQESFIGYMQKCKGGKIYPAVIPMMDNTKFVLWYCTNRKSNSWRNITLSMNECDNYNHDWEIYVRLNNEPVVAGIKFESFLYMTGLSENDYNELPESQQKRLQCTYKYFSNSLAMNRKVYKLIRAGDSKKFVANTYDIIILSYHCDPKTSVRTGFTMGEYTDENKVADKRINSIVRDLIDYNNSSPDIHEQLAYDRNLLK